MYAKPLTRLAVTLFNCVFCALSYRNSPKGKQTAPYESGARSVSVFVGDSLETGLQLSHSILCITFIMRSIHYVRSLLAALLRPETTQM